MFTSHGEALNALENLQKKIKNVLIIVEGKKDKAAIEALLTDFFENTKAASEDAEHKENSLFKTNREFSNCDHNNILCLNKNKESLYETAERIAQKYERIMLMLDIDKKGRELAKEMKSYLQQLGVQVDCRTGTRLLKLANSSTVEGMSLRF